MPQNQTILWSSQFNIGDEEIDRQHKKIIDLLNNLIKKPDIINDQPAFSDMLNALAAYSKEHLAYEEALLQKINYPQFDEHKVFHNKYLDFVSHLCVDNFLDGKTSVEQVNRFLKYWWEDHILIEDMKYKPYLQKNEE